MININFYTKEHCPLCDDALALIEILQHDYSFSIEMRDIYSNDEWLEQYQLSIPVVSIGDMELDCTQISLETVEAALQIADKNQKT